MYEIFGEMGSAEELNTLAENLVNEGDIDSLKKLAEENGIEEEYALDFANGDSEIFVDATMAAEGKLFIEGEALKPKGIMQDWLSYIEAEAFEDEEVAKAVRKKGKSLKGCIASLMELSFRNREPVDKDILEMVNLKPKPSRVEFYVPNMREAKEAIRKYYMGEKR